MSDKLSKKDSQKIIDEMIHGTPNTPKRMKTIKRAKEVYARATKNDSDSLGALLDEVVEWGEETFPTVTLRAKIEHLRREVVELQHRPTAAEEIADIMMITAHIASDSGIDLTQAIADKFEIVKAREWGEPDEDGVVEHTREGEPRYLFEDLLHVYDNFLNPKLSSGITEGNVRVLKITSTVGLTIWGIHVKNARIGSKILTPSGIIDVAPFT